MSYSNNWNKKAALFASGLVCALAFRVPISTAAFCVTRFNIDPSYLGIFSNRIVNAMLMAQLFGNWFGVLFTALNGKGKLITVSVSNWLCLVCFSFALFCFSHSEEGHLTGYYWSVIIANLLSKISEAIYFDISSVDINFFISSSLTSHIFISLVKILLLILFGDTSFYSQDILAIISFKTTNDHQFCMWMFAILMTLAFLISVLWTSVVILVTDNCEINKNNIKLFKFGTGAVIGAILSVPGGLLGAAVGSLIVICLNLCFKEATFVKVIERRQIIFCIVGAIVVFVAVVGGIKYVPDEEEKWLSSFNDWVNLGLAKYPGLGLSLGAASGALVGLCITDCKRSKLSLFATCSLLGASLGIVSGLVISAANELKDKMNEIGVDETKLAPVLLRAANEHLDKKTHVKHLLTLKEVQKWANQLGPGASGQVNKENNKWTKTLHSAIGLNVTRASGGYRSYWRLNQATVATDAVRAGSAPNTIDITVSWFNVNDGDILDHGDDIKIQNVIQNLFDTELGTATVQVENVKWQAKKDKVILTLTLSNNANVWDEAIRSVEGGMIGLNSGGKLKLSRATIDMMRQVEVKTDNQITINVTLSNNDKMWDEAIVNITDSKVKHSMNGYWDFINATIVPRTGFRVEDRTPGKQIVINLEGVKDVQDGQSLVYGAEGGGKIEDSIIRVFDRELGPMTLRIGSISGVVKWGQVILTLVISFGQPDQNGLKALTKEFQKVFDRAFGTGAVKVTVTSPHLDVLKRQLTFTVTISHDENNWAQSIRGIKYAKTTSNMWNMEKAYVDLTNKGVTRSGNQITITVGGVHGATKGEMLNEGEEGEGRITQAVQKALDKELGDGAVTVVHGHTTAQEGNKIKIVATIAGGTGERKGWLVNQIEKTDEVKGPTKEALFFRKQEVIGGWVCSLIMNVISFGTIYAVYPGIAPCSIADFRYFNRIDTIILMMSATVALSIISISGLTVPTLPKQRNNHAMNRDTEAKASVWVPYTGLFFLIVQIFSMLFTVIVVNYPESNWANAVRMNPLRAGALTIVMITGQLTSTGIGMNGVTGAYGCNMINLSNTTGMALALFMSLLGEGYLTELKKYEPGKWPTQAMGKCEGFRWLLGRVFANAFEILNCTCTKDLRRDLMIVNSQQASALIS